MISKTLTASFDKSYC